MSRRSKIVLVLATILSVLLAIAGPVSAQPAVAEGSAAASSGTAPQGGSRGFPVRVTEDGYVSVGYDVFAWCGNVSAGVSDEYVRAEFEATRHAVEEGALGEDAAPTEQELRDRLEEQSAEQARACEEAGFPTAEAPPARTEAAAAARPGLPGTGGAPLLPLAAGLLLTVVAGLVAVRAPVGNRIRTGTWSAPGEDPCAVRIRVPKSCDPNQWHDMRSETAPYKKVGD